MNPLHELLSSPQLYPIILNVDRRVLRFVRMSPETYKRSVFLDMRTHFVGSDTFDIKLDDLLLASLESPEPVRPVHHIINSAYCCSTLLSRYFELLPSCLVLKEPRLLAQLAIMSRPEHFPWEAVFDLCLRLLSRTFDAQQMVIIKPVDVCSLIGESLLQQNPRATITFLMTSLRHFLLSILKSGERRDWARSRLHTFMRAAPPVGGIDIDPEKLTVAEAAAYLWIIHRSLGLKMCSGSHASRVIMLDGNHLAESPKTALSAVFHLCGLSLSDAELDALVSDPSMSKYSKDLSRPYDNSSREKETADVERFWGSEADEGMEWAEKLGLLPLTIPAALAGRA